MAKKYVSLKRLIHSWPKQAGELESAILANLSDQDDQGRFSAGTFRLTSSGELSQPGYLSALVTRMRTSGYAFLRAEASETLDEVVVCKSKLAEYCDAFDVRPPHCVVGFWKSLVRRNTRFSAPPPYPSTAEEVAEQQRRIEREQGAICEAELERLKLDTERKLSYLEDLLEEFSEAVAQGDPHGKHKRTFAVPFNWDRVRAEVDLNLSQMHDESTSSALVKRLAHLDRSLELRLAEAERRSNENNAALKNNSSFSEAKVGRYLEWQVAKGNWQSKSELLRQARGQLGRDIPERAFNRIWSETVPPQWHQPGRRSPNRHPCKDNSGVITAP